MTLVSGMENVSRIGLLVVLGGGAARAQDATGEREERVAWLHGNAVPIRSIDPADLDFDDLSPLKAALGDARVVVLGEETHGDGATFLAKVRLIEFLHQELGFDVVAWESGLLECRAVDAALANEATPLPEATEGVFAHWSQAAQVVPLFEYVRASKASGFPITVAGVDSQLTSRRSATYLSQAVRALFARVDPSLLDGALMDWERALEAYHAGKRFARSVEEANATEQATDTEALCNGLRAMVDLIESRRAELEKHSPPAEVELVRRALLGADHQVRLMHASNPNGMVAGAETLGPERDRLMGENLVFLAEELFPARKLVLWCASLHAVHAASRIEDPAYPGVSPYEGYVTMGEVARRALGPALYTIGFTAGRGSHGWIYTSAGTPLDAPQPEWIEADFAALGEPFVFVDFRGLPGEHWLREPQVMRPMGYAAMKAVWPEQMDAVIFVDEMFRASRDGLSPKGYRLSADD